jgi:hypothetical protein
VTVDLARSGPPVVWGEPIGRGGGPLTWRPVVPSTDRPAVLAQQFALATCASGHECALSGRVHRVAADGVVAPSYVCPVAGCGFHVWVRLLDWSAP